MIMIWKRTVQASTATKTWFFNIPSNTFIFSMSLELISLKTYKEQQFITRLTLVRRNMDVSQSASNRREYCSSICRKVLGKQTT